MYNIHAFENEIFEEGRKLLKRIEEAAALLKKHGYVVYESKKKRSK